jgi:hypothetical protein
MDALSLGGSVRVGYDSFVPPEVPLPYKSVIAGTVGLIPLFRGRQPEGSHQLRTIVTTPVSLIRSPASFGRKVEISGITRSW